MFLLSLSLLLSPPPFFFFFSNNFTNWWPSEQSSIGSIFNPSSYTWIYVLTFILSSSPPPPPPFFFNVFSNNFTNWRPSEQSSICSILNPSSCTWIYVLTFVISSSSLAPPPPPRPFYFYFWETSWRPRGYTRISSAAFSIPVVHVHESLCSYFHYISPPPFYHICLATTSQAGDYQSRVRSAAFSMQFMQGKLCVPTFIIPSFVLTSFLIFFSTNLMSWRLSEQNLFRGILSPNSSFTWIDVPTFIFVFNFVVIATWLFVFLRLLSLLLFSPFFIFFLATTWWAGGYQSRVCSTAFSEWGWSRQRRRGRLWPGRGVRRSFLNERSRCK